jgi:hypothetical protein
VSIPTPVKATATEGLMGSFEATVKTASKLPSAFGIKVTSAVQLSPSAKLKLTPPQLPPVTE